MQPANKITITLNEGSDHLTNCVKNRVWYIGKANQLESLYRQLDGVQSTMFWKAPMTKGLEIRKTHSGIPALMVDMIKDIVIADYNGMEITSKGSTAYKELWEQIEKENQFADLLDECIKDLVVVGDGAFKISYDKEISDTMILEWFPAERVEFTYVRSRCREVIFHTEYYHNRQRYDFQEIYAYGSITYKLFRDDKEVNLDVIPQTAWAVDGGVEFDKSLIWAVPIRFRRSEQYNGRGKSFFDGKEDAFDTLDESWSQWMDASRASRTKTYIPENLIPFNPDGKMIKPNPFDNRFIETQNGESENSVNKIVTESPTIQHEALQAAYYAALDNALQGVMSPSTLGIDTKKLDNAEAQREKEKTTLYTRQKIVDILTEALPKLVIATINAQQVIEKKNPVTDIEVTVKFGEYANPSFESQVETVSKARTGGIMSVETAVEELYGDTKDTDWKKEEARRVKEQSGITELDESYEEDDIDVDV